MIPIMVHSLLEALSSFLKECMVRVILGKGPRTYFAATQLKKMLGKDCLPFTSYFNDMSVCRVT